jgi:hypothetical protein
MIPFDGQFAQETILPLTFTAYVEPWNARKDPVLAAFDSFAEILVDTGDADFKKMAAKPQMSDSSHAALAKMRQPGDTATSVSPVGISLPAASETSAPASGGPDAPQPAPTGAAEAPAPPPVALHDRFGWVCRKDDRLMVTFRGTQTPGDWLHNLDFIAEPYLPVPGRGTVHQGFQLVYYAIRKNLLAIVNKMGVGCTELVVTGHSLGGALATLAMPDLMNQAFAANISPILYNVASPRVGHDDFQNYFDSHINVSYRIVNQWDVVPHVPPALAGYVHVGLQLNIDSGFSFDIVRNHVLDTGYAPGLAKWNESHRVVQTAKLGTFAPASLVGVSA